MLDLDDDLALDDETLRAAGMLTVAEVLAGIVARHPDRTCLVQAQRDGSERSWTWRELDDWSSRYARTLVRLGIRRGAVVSSFLHNTLEHVALGVATWKAQGCFVPLDPAMPAAERAAVVELARPTVVVTQTGADGTTAVADLDGGDSGPLPDGFALPGKAITSGGSTGRPKLIVTARPWGWVEGTEDTEVVKAMGVRPEMRLLVASPLHHNWGFDLCFLGLLLRCEIVLMERFDAARAVALIRRHRIQYTGLVPTMMQRIAQLVDLDPADLGSLEVMMHSAAPCPDVLKRRWLDLLGPERVHELYGGSEGFGVAVLRGDEWLAHPGSVGRPIDTQVRIVGSDGAVLPPGEVGMVYLRRTDLMNHAVYSGAPPAPSLDDGFASLGDLGWLDEDGYLYLAGRRADLIISGGVNVYPAEVEAALTTHPAVADAVVVGLADQDWGQRVHAVVELRSGAQATPAELIQTCRERLAPAKVPKSVEIVAAIPRSEAGKVRRSAVAAAAADQPPRDTRRQA